MVSPVIADDEFIRMFLAVGATQMAKELSVSERSIYKRRRNIEARGSIPLTAPSNQALEAKYPHRRQIEIKNGSVVIGSDFHIWPGSDGPALRAFKKFCDDIRPAAVILNGDVLDFPKISRHPPIGWEETPSPVEEIEAAQDHLHDIATAVRRARKLWTLGNHDARFETRLATVASEYKNIKGIHLGDHFALWEKGWSVWINNEVVVKHRFKGGIHATHNNTVNAGKTMITGHLHSAKVTPFTDYNGTRFGVDTGCIANPDHKAFTDYTEDNPKNWVSGFAVLTFKDGRLLWPELVTAYDDNHVQFRGEVIKV